MSDNLRFYVMGKTVPDDAKRNFTRKGGFSGTDINSMWRIKCITEMFGPIGIGWYYEITDRRVEYYETTDETKVYVDMALYVRDPDTGEWSKPIYGTGGNDAVIARSGVKAANDECYKMATTDAFGQCCKWLGIGADVYWASDRTKYTIEEDGTVSAHTPSDEEIREENRTRNRERMQNDPFYGGAQQRQAAAVVDTMGADAVFVDAQAIAEAAKARRDSVNVKDARIAISKALIADPDNETIKGYRERFGRYISKWEESKVIDCYLDLQTEGSE